MVIFATFLASLVLAPSPAPEIGTAATLAMDQLKAGNSRFISGQTLHPHQDNDRRELVAKGQSPFAIVLTCADSRLSPEIVFDQGLGDLFVIRVAGNVVDKFTLASIEYAAEHLGSQLLVVLGHERCGAVKAALDAGTTPPKATDAHVPDKHSKGKAKASEHGHEPAHVGHIGDLIAEIAPAVTESKSWPGDPLENAVKSNALRTAKKICFGAPLSEMVASGRLTVVSAIYDLDSGRVKLLSQSQPKSGSSFVQVHKH